MQVKQSLASLLAVLLTLMGVTFSVVGCDQLGLGKDSSKEKDEDEDDDKKKKKKKDDDEEEEDEDKADKGEDTSTSDSSTAGVKDCPGQTEIGGTRKVLRPLSVYDAADSTSTRLTGLAPGTLVNLKFQCGNWIMLEYPSGPGELSPGWVNVAVNSTQWKVEEEPPDAGEDKEEKKDDEDAGTEEKKEEKDDEDAGTEEKKEETPDAGRKVIKIPPMLKKGQK